MIKRIGFITSLLLSLSFMQNTANAQQAVDAGRNRNICKDLKGKVLIYIIFVDTKNNNPWTEFDINTAFENAGKASDWIRTIAQKQGVQLETEIKYFQSGKMKTAAVDLPCKTIEKTVKSFIPGYGNYRINKWGDKVAFKVGTKIKFPGEIDKSIIKKPKDNVELISKIRDIYRVDNVALIYLLNNTYTQDISITPNTDSEEKIEYAIASDKSATTLTKLVLKLFGAADFSVMPAKNMPAEQRKFISDWPNEIMVTTKPDLEKASISPLTNYLLGWSEKADSISTRIIQSK